MIIVKDGCQSMCWSEIIVVVDGGRYWSWALEHVMTMIVTRISHQLETLY